MSELPSQYKNIIVYDIIGRISIKALLDRKVFYECCYYVIDEEDDPLPIRDSIAYLSNQNGNKKIYILKLKTVYGEFSE